MHAHTWSVDRLIDYLRLLPVSELGHPSHDSDHGWWIRTYCCWQTRIGCGSSSLWLWSLVSFHVRYVLGLQFSAFIGLNMYFHRISTCFYLATACNRQPAYQQAIWSIALIHHADFYLQDCSILNSLGIANLENGKLWLTYMGYRHK